MSYELDTGRASSGVAREVRSARRSAGLTQRQLGNKLGVESITVSRWERGATSPSLARLEQIARVTGTPLGELVSFGRAGPHAAELSALRVEFAELRGLVDRMVRALDRLAHATEADTRSSSEASATAERGG